jgi:hypothetical protein
VTIFNMADGWRDLCTEGPCDLYDKEGWEVWKTSEMAQWRVDLNGSFVRQVETLSAAMSFVDEQCAAGRKR